MNGGVMLATLILNERPWLEKLYEQHRNWPGLRAWVFVEATDRVYAQTNPQLVSPFGLSVDGTTEYLQELAAQDERVRHIRFGFTDHSNPAQGKIPARNAYLEIADKLQPDWVVIADADEFYTHNDQQRIADVAERVCHLGRHNAVRFRQRHIWRPPLVSQMPLFTTEVIGAYWSVPHTRVWRWRKGTRYVSNHNAPEGSVVVAMENRAEMPQCVHLGFAASLQSRAAKHAYYVARGEGVNDSRQMYVDCRRAFEHWPNCRLPHGAKLVDYKGPIPEVFQNEKHS